MFFASPGNAGEVGGSAGSGEKRVKEEDGEDGEAEGRAKKKRKEDTVGVGGAGRGRGVRGNSSEKTVGGKVKSGLNKNHEDG